MEETRSKKKMVITIILGIIGILLLITAVISGINTYRYEAAKKPKIPSGQKLDLSNYELVFEDDFNGTELDLTKWSYRANGKRREGFNSPNQVFIENGNLIIRAEHLKDGEFGEGWYGGMIRTVDEYINGYFEIKCKVSEGGGFWSAFWLNSTGMNKDSNGGINGAEIDIFEAFNYDDKRRKDSVSINVHVDGYGEELKSKQLGNWAVQDPYNTFNTYGLEWTKDEYIFYINGVEATRSSFAQGVSKALEYVILSMEIPSEFTEEPGFSTDFIVDYVKIYQQK